MGGDCIETLGIYDVNQDVCARWETELNQAAFPWDYDALPTVEILTEEQLLIAICLFSVPPKGFLL